MEYRRLGRTNKQVSLLGIGGGYVMLRSIEEGTQLYQRAADLGVNYFDGRYGYSSTMQRPVIRQNRQHFVVGSKTASTARDDVLRRINEDLKELDTPYLDVYFLRTYNHDMVDAHFAPGGSVEGLLEARRQGLIHALGMAGHSDMTALARGVRTGVIDVVEFPLNVARREALDELVPVCLEHDTGMVIMKPMNVGLTPAQVCLPWLANQPIHVMAAGVSTIEHLELDAALLDRLPMSLTAAEEAEAEHWRRAMDTQTCRICDRVCQVVCDQKLNIDWLLYHNVFHNELRRLGARGFLEYPFAPWVKEQAETSFTNTVAAIQSCTRCGKCEQVCPYHLPVIDMLEQIKEQQAELLGMLRQANWDEAYKGSDSPLSPKVLASWGAGSRKGGA